MTSRREIAAGRALAQQVAQARVSAASMAVAVAVAVREDVAAVGAGIPPNLAAKLAEIDALADRVDALET